MSRPSHKLFVLITQIFISSQLEAESKQNETVVKQLQGDVTALRDQLAERDREIKRIGALAKQEISRKIRENETVLREYETKARDAMQRVEQLETALCSCRDELETYVDQYAATKRAQEQTIAAKETQVA